MRQFIGLCAALAFVAASPGAFALKIADTAPATRDAVMMAGDSFTYAAETLLMDTENVTEVEDDSTTYYNINGEGTNGALVLSAPADVGATVGDIYVVAVTLDGMVFRTAPALAAADATNADFDVATGGAVGDKMVVYRLTAGSISGATSVLNVTAGFAVSEGGGSATLTMTNQTLASLNIGGVDGSAVHSGNVIKVASALKETPMASDLTAEVVSSFKKFAGGMTVGHVGSLTVGIESHRIATDSDGSVVANLEDILQNAVTEDAPDSTVSFMGDFSFASKVFAHGDDDCGADDETAGDPGAGTDTDLASDETDIRMMEGEGDDAVVTNTTMAVSLDATDNGGENPSWMNYLCIMVQGDDTDDMDAPRIPDTDAYTAMGSYKALEDAANGPTGTERMLGEINRDGTTAHIPYMTTYEGYNQRIVLSNRSSADAPYEMTFRPEVGVTAVRSDMAEGTLMGNTTVTFRTSDLVTLTGGARTAATIILEAQPKNIDVTSVIVNKVSQDTDTVVHHSE